MIAYRVQVAEGIPLLAKSGEADVDLEGVFSLHNIAPGNYLLMATGPKCGSSLENECQESIIPTFYPGTSYLEDAELLHVRANMYRPYNFALMCGMTFDVSGKIEGNMASPNLQIDRVDALREYRIRVDTKIKYDSSTGHFVAHGLPDGYYVLSMTYSSPKMHADDPDVEVTGQKKFRVTGNDVDGLSLVSGCVASVSGRVVLDGRSDAAKAQPILQDISDMSQKIGLSLSVDGYFSVGHLPCGIYRVIVPRSTKAFVESITLDAFHNMDQTITVTSGNINDLVIGISTRSATIEGRITGEVENLSGVCALARNEDTQESNLSQIDAAGRFKIEGLGPGDYDLYVLPNAIEVAYNVKLGLTRDIKNTTVHVDKMAAKSGTVIPVHLSLQ